MLAILKAGAAYVPLDPAYPPERLDYLVRDSGIEVLLDRARLTELERDASIDDVRQSCTQPVAPRPHPPIPPSTTPTCRCIPTIWPT